MKILFVHNVDISWTRNDYNLLSKENIVEDCYIRSKIDVLKSINPSIILRNEVVYLWFASLNFFPILFLAHLFRKKIIIVTGGFDVASEPEIGYGAYSSPNFLNYFRNKMFSWATKISCFSYSAKNEAIKNAEVPEEKIDVTYLGFEEVRTPLIPWNKRKKQIITIGAVTKETFLRKGHKYFIELAKQMPDWEFVLIGRLQDGIESLLSIEGLGNIKATGFISDEERDKIINNSRFYLQLSNHEGFGASVVDAALMGCYPIVFNKGSLPEVVTTHGKVVEFEDYNSIIQAINSNYERNDLDVEEIRSSYQKTFPLSTREEKLRDLISNKL